MSDHGDLTHQAISSYFIGPQAENMGYFKDNISTILQELEDARKKYKFEGDQKFITSSIQNSEEFQRITRNFAHAVKKAAKLMGSHSIPFWNPRYQAHMCTDLSMPALLGYFMTMIYNPNNVALEASPLTTVAEMEVGEQLCHLFGYNIDPSRKDVPTGWGHVTCGGTVANLESIWVARNLKFYPLALRKAMCGTVVIDGKERKGPLNFVADRFMVTTCKGERKLFTDLSTWELLNLRPKTVLDLPQELHEQFGISPKFVESALQHFNIQSTGKDILEREFEVKQPIKCFLSNTRHYSWPKGGAIAGLGSDAFEGIEVDDAARINLDALQERLQRCLDEGQAVYAVVAIMGSTEEGAVDRLSAILAMRQRFQSKGLSFLVHADAAWGGYFATMLPRNLYDLPRGPSVSNPEDGFDGGAEGFVPDLSLKLETQEDLLALKYADSITVDPHKAGYIPYPGGSLVYRDGRMRYLVTWTAPVLSQGSETGMGIYGVEGSKPGAAAMSIWLSNKCIGLNPQGYGALLSEVSFTCTRLSAHWAAMTTKDDDYFMCVPFHKLPSEWKDPLNEQAIEEEKDRIRREILPKNNREIVESDAGKPTEEKLMTLLRGLGSDLNINAFALNWRYDDKDRTWNTDLEEANYLTRHVVERLSICSPDQDPTKIPFYLTSTEFTNELYGKCAKEFKRRLGLPQCDRPLFVLRNVVMSPFPTDNDFISTMVDYFRSVVEDGVRLCRKRNARGPAIHRFVMQGTDEIFLVYQPSFHLGKHRQQIILAVEVEDHAKSDYIEIRESNPEDPIFLKSSVEIDLQQVVSECERGSRVSFKGTIYTHHGGPVRTSTPVTLKRVIKSRPLNSANREADYPEDYMPFYLYGSGKQWHIAHMLLQAPNATFSAGNVKLDDKLASSLSQGHTEKGAILAFTEVPEASMQPFPASKSELPTCFFFQPDKKYKVKVWDDPKDVSAAGPGLLEGLREPVEGTITLSKEIHIDLEWINKDPFEQEDRVGKWRDEFSQIGKKLEKRG
ncbi:pyridoxal phosphate-dependent transferase [Aspergillus pseudotamarii]|uniref:Pyridoxal phosphate-dependent transferase n=1 Tax=Aspergillus pseudotamarii TaxID=132259 RepID=A0A5N6TB71_ASPPS|nr:pyridoxal phosphate-dependent transferase [Aspergillus pseudotamarii]KAE8143371.1 pyridoxal phosphate-dependent transferase [Aspergillus pseudotamarii]